jgi:hypothetical protein
MQRRIAQAFLIALASVLSAPALGADGCYCRHKDGRTPLGQSACIRSANGGQMARCERVLNNTSWKFTGAPCPLAEADRKMTPRPSQSRQG